MTKIFTSGKARFMVSGGRDAGKQFSLVPGEVAIVGRGADADMQLLYQGLSRLHCRLAFSATGNDGVKVADLQTTNGTSVNGEIISEVSLFDGDKISMGDLVLVVSLPSSPRKGTETHLDIRDVKRRRDSTTDVKRKMELDQR